MAKKANSLSHTK